VLGNVAPGYIGVGPTDEGADDVEGYVAGNPDCPTVGEAVGLLRIVGGPTGVTVAPGITGGAMVEGDAYWVAGYWVGYWVAVFIGIALLMAVAGGQVPGKHVPGMALVMLKGVAGEVYIGVPVPAAVGPTTVGDALHAAAGTAEPDPPM
jgi:hypothetical protein